MIAYADFRPTAFDPPGMSSDIPRDWLVVPVMQTRDSDCLSQSNFAIAIQIMADVDPDCENPGYSVHRFGHWGPGWFEIIVVNPNSLWEAAAADIENSLADYPVLDDQDFCEREVDAANDMWKECFTPQERIDYIRRFRSQFDFHDFSDLRAQVAGEYFGGYASELLFGR